MLRRTFLQLLLANLAIAATQNCIWADGSKADNFVPCVDSTQTSGSYCLNGEACLDTGLCYGGLGLIYRGACINQWGGGGCPTYCDTVSNNAWANIFPCAFKGTGSKFGPESFWCGADSTNQCTSENGSFILKIAPPGNVKKVRAGPSISSPIDSSTPTGSATFPPNQPQSTSPAPAKDPKKDERAKESSNAGAIGLGVSLVVVILLWAASAFWQFRTDQKQKATIAQLTETTTVEVKDDLYRRRGYEQAYTEVEGHVVGSELDSPVRKAQPVELGH